MRASKETIHAPNLRLKLTQVLVGSRSETVPRWYLPPQRSRAEQFVSLLGEVGSLSGVGHRDIWNSGYMPFGGKATLALVFTKVVRTLVITRRQTSLRC